MSSQPEPTIDVATTRAPIAEQPDRSPPLAIRPAADQDAPVVVPVPQSMSVPQAPSRATVPPQHSSVHVVSNLHTLIMAVSQEDMQQVAAAQQRRDLNAVVHSVLIIGLVISSALMLVGIGLNLVYQREFPVAVPSIADVLIRVAALRPSGFLALGLLALIATPILRVLGSIGAFLYERDWRFAGITTLVLLILTISLLFGKG